MFQILLQKKQSFLIIRKIYHRSCSNVWILLACDENIMPPEDKDKTTLSEVSLLYFPTGGGKTEAFLGVLVFNLFFDRFRGKSCGVTSILRYPLRLLSVQQVQRLANTLAQAELLRRADPLIKDTEEFSLGYFVGDNNTPNNIKRDRAIRYRDMRQEEIDEDRILDICPFCGKPTVHLRFNEETYRLMHFCDNPGCSSGEALPVYMVDTEIYRYLPSAIISTVDKMAILGNNPSFRNILAGAPMRCPKHGFTSTRKCLVAQVSSEFCDEEVQNFEEVTMYDPAPTLFIQDELHLIRESLSTYASHYESFVDYYVQNVSPSTGVLERQMVEEHAKRDALILERAGYADRELHLRLLMELVEILEESAEQIQPLNEHNVTFEHAGGVVTGGEAGARIVVKRVDREPGSCYDAEEFFRLTRPRYPEGVIEEGMVRGYDNEMVIRYLDRVIVNDLDYEVRLKGGITVTV